MDFREINLRASSIIFSLFNINAIIIGSTMQVGSDIDLT